MKGDTRSLDRYNSNLAIENGATSTQRRLGWESLAPCLLDPMFVFRLDKEL